MSSTGRTTSSRAKKGRQSAPGVPAQPSTPVQASQSSSSVTTPLNQPPRSRASTGGIGMSESSPARQRRTAEKKNLQALNHRLEFYILDRRNADTEREHLVGELKRIKGRETKNVAREKKAFAEENAQLRKERDNATRRAARVDSEKNALASHVDMLEDQKKENKARIEDQAEHLKKLAEDLRDVKAQNTGLTADNENLQHADGIATIQAKKLADELDKARVDRDKAREDVAQLEASRLANHNDIERANAQLKELQQRARAENDEISKSNQELEKVVRDEYNLQLQNIIAERHKQYEADKDEMLANLKLAYDTKADALREKVGELGHENSAALDRAKRERQQRKVIEKSYNALKAERDGFLTRIQALEDMLKHERQKPEIERAGLKDQIKTLKEAYTRKDAEFEDLMDVKIGLAMEIKVYREMLDKEESRIQNMKSPHKKRKREDGTAVPGAASSSSSSSSSVHPGAADSAGRDASDEPARAKKRPGRSRQSASSKQPASEGLNGGATIADNDAQMASANDEPKSKKHPNYSGLVQMLLHKTNCEIRNLTNKELSLEGWKLTNPQREKLLEFPDDMSLEPNGSMYVYENDEDTEKSEHDNALTWPDDFNIGREIVLLDPSNATAARLVDPRFEGADHDHNKSCLLM